MKRKMVFFNEGKKEENKFLKEERVWRRELNDEGKGFFWLY